MNIHETANGVGWFNALKTNSLSVGPVHAGILDAGLGLSPVIMTDMIHVMGHLLILFPSYIAVRLPRAPL